MRQRYYDTEIKRFINQDILTGSIGDSQSLNRYSYVQGNPVSFSDPFGLSPFERLSQAFRPLHAVLNIAGIIPGPIGMLASLAQAGLYGLEGNSALAAHYLSQSLMIGLAGPVGGAVLGALSKMGPATKVILGTVLGAQSLYTAGVAGINLYNSASKIADGLLNGDMSWLDAFCEGSMALNSAAGIYYSLKGLVNSCELTLKGLDDVATKYAAKQEAWYREHVGYTTDNLGNIQESGASVMPQSVAKNRNIMVYVSKNVDKGGRKTDFYVTPSGEAVPATGYRYMSRNAEYMSELKETMMIPSNTNGTYISFDRFDTPNPQKLQVPHDASIRGKFDTLQIIDDIRIPNGKWGTASWKEPITKDFPNFGQGGATQAITNHSIILDELEDLLH